MEAARGARAGRRKNLSLKLGARRQKESFEAAFESFYREHVAEVYQYALAVLGNSPDAEDVTQQTFLNAYRAFERGERPRKAHNWLIKIAHNVCRMRWRQSSRRPQEVPLERAGEPAAPDDDRPSLDEVLSALAKLPFNQRAAIVMREVEDRSYAEIAEVLGVTVPAVEALLFRARGNLRAHRKSLAGALGVAPVPASLGSFFGGGSGGLIAAGGAAFGSGLALKVAAIVATGAIAGGLGYKAANAVATPEASATPAPEARGFIRPSTANPLRLPVLQRRAAAAAVAAFRHQGWVPGDRKLSSAPTNDRPSESGVAGSSVAGSAAEPASEPATPSTVAGATTGTVKGVVSSTPLTSAVPTTSVTVSTPVPPVTVSTPVTSVAVTVPTVTLPPPPNLP
jgi:RNA polymerase sigma-70 factor (ECF subfamily)